MANQRSRGIDFALFIAIRQLVLHGIADDEDAHIGGGVLLDRLALADENFAVDAEQIPAFHPGFARNAADEQRPVHIAKSFIEIGRGRDAFEEREGAIVQFHDDALERAERRRDFDQARGGPAGPGRTSSPKRCEKGASIRSDRQRR